MNYNGYNPYYYPNTQNNVVQRDFIGVQSEQEARCYPVAPGNSVTFRDEGAPYIYIKTMGYSQLDRPSFVKYRLVKEETETEPRAESTAKNIDLSAYALKTDFEEVQAKLDALQKELLAIKEKPKKKVIKEVEVEDDE